MEPKIFAIDFDGTLCENAWPSIGEPRNDAIYWIKKAKENGHKLILWTCREGPALDAAIAWCADRDLYFDAVNDNLEEHKTYFGGNCRKIFADYYIDDKAIAASDMLRVYYYI